MLNVRKKSDPMTTQTENSQEKPVQTFYGDSWDNYVAEVYDKMKRDDSVYPGDEWGNPAWWDVCYERLLKRAGAKNWRRAVEIGPGSGKYTALLLERSESEVAAFDVSKEFLKVLRSRCEDYVAKKRLTTFLLGCQRADEMLGKIEDLGWRGSVDAVFSIDAMVHVDLQYLTAYFVTAALCLQQGGKLIMTLADATSAKGRQKLMDDIKLYYPMQGQISLKFEFVSPDIVRSALESLGFKIELLEHDSPNAAEARDMFLIAEKVDDKAAEIEAYLR